MNWAAAIVAMYAGAFALTFVLVRLASWLLRRVGVPPLGIAHAGVAVIVFFGAAYGNADGGPPRFDFAAALCLPPVVVWLLVDWWWARRKQRATK